MKSSVLREGRYFGSMMAIEDLNVIKVDVYIVDGGTYQPIVGVNLAPCAFSGFCSVCENFITDQPDTKESGERNFVSLQKLGNQDLAVVTFALANEVDVTINNLVVNKDISTLIINLAKSLLDRSPTFNSDCS